MRGDQERGKSVNKQELMYFVPTNESVIPMISLLAVIHKSR